MIEVPVKQHVEAGDVHFSFRMLLDGSYYTLTFRWNERASTWRFSLSTGDGAPIVQALPVLSDRATTTHVRHLPGMPPGVFTSIDSSDSGDDPDIDELGSRVGFYYMEEADLS